MNCRFFWNLDFRRRANAEGKYNEALFGRDGLCLKNRYSNKRRLQ